MFIALHKLCKEYKALPHEGGVLDQDSYLIHGLGGVIAAAEQRAELDRQRQKRR